MHVAGLLTAYLLGSTPFAWVAGRLLKGIDLRRHGSGNLGATNVYRTLGGPAAAAVLLLDLAKGAIPALFFFGLFGGESHWWPVWYGLAAVAGHVRPYFGAFKGGGKGVATASGVFAALAPGPFLASAVAFVVVVGISRYVSLGSMVGAVALTLALLVERGASSPLFQVALPVCLFVFWTHRANIARLRRGEESRIGRLNTTA
jgi:acyl phosphate:glycerol-3-phosphate acyltransferase